MKVNCMSSGTTNQNKSNSPTSKHSMGMNLLSLLVSTASE